MKGKKERKDASKRDSMRASKFRHSQYEIEFCPAHCWRKKAPKAMKNLTFIPGARHSFHEVPAVVLLRREERTEEESAGSERKKTLDG